MPFDISHITRPTLLLDPEKAQKNIQKIADKCRQAGIRFRPHLKTPQSNIIATWFADVGVSAVTVSSVRMAVYFCDSGWHDILIAFPVNVREARAINDLAARCRLGLILDNLDQASLLSKSLSHDVDVYIEIDCGQNRSGIPVDDIEATLSLARDIQNLPFLRFRGILSHAGHTYQARGKEEVLEKHARALGKLRKVKLELRLAGYRDVKLSYGDTPSASLAEDFTDVDELRPGNFIFYDWMQVGIGSCKPEQIATVLACPVVEVYPRRQEAVIHGGAVHLSKDSLQDAAGQTYYGVVGMPAVGGWTMPLQGCFVKSLSQEHGVVHLSPEVCNILRAGDLLMVFPVHSCLTADLMGGYVTTSGLQISMMPKF